MKSLQMNENWSRNEIQVEHFSQSMQDGLRLQVLNVFVNQTSSSLPALISLFLFGTADAVHSDRKCIALSYKMGLCTRKVGGGLRTHFSSCTNP